MYNPRPGADAYGRRIGEFSGSEFRSRAFERREVTMSVDVVYPSRGIRDVKSTRGLVRSISENGASIATSAPGQMPENFYMEIGRDSGKMTVPCYVVGRNADTVHVRFGHEVSSSALDRLIERHALGGRN